MIIILIPPTIAETVGFSLSPNSTTSFGCKKNLFQVDVDVFLPKTIKEIKKRKTSPYEIFAMFIQGWYLIGNICFHKYPAFEWFVLPIMAMRKCTQEYLCTIWYIGWSILHFTAPVWCDHHCGTFRIWHHRWIQVNSCIEAGNEWHYSSRGEG